MDDAKKLEILSGIMRASHFEWRRAALALCPEMDPIELVKKYWEEVGKDTAQFYLKKIDPAGNIPEQIARLFVSSSQAMGENAVLSGTTEDGKHQAKHIDCPWYQWHQREHLLQEDQVGCDHWLQTVIHEINRTLGTSVKCETVSSLPAGDGCCLRRFWTAERNEP